MKTTIGIIVVLIVVVSVAVPIISDQAATLTISENNDNAEYKLALLEEKGSVTFTAGTNQIVIDGTTWTTTGLYAITDSTIFTSLVTGNFNIFDIGSNQHRYGNLSSIVFTDGTWTAYDTSETPAAIMTGTYSYLLYPSNNGTYGFWNNVGHWTSNSSTYYSISASAFGIVLGALKGSSVESVIGMTQDTNETIEPSTISLTPYYTQDNGNSRYYSYVATTINSSEPTSQNVTRMIAPISYLTDEENPVGAMISIIPILMIVGLIVAVIVAFLRRSDA